MYRDDLDALWSRLEATERDLEQERQRRQRAQAEAEHTRLVARYTNPDAGSYRLQAMLVAALLGALLATPLTLYLSARATRAEGRVAELHSRVDYLADALESSVRQVERYAAMVPKVYASGGPSWLHDGLKPLVAEMVACHREHQAAGPIYLKGAARGGRVLHAAVVGAGIATPGAACILSVVDRARFEMRSGVTVPFHYAVYPPSRADGLSVATRRIVLGR
jgi:hypothetical protein